MRAECFNGIQLFLYFLLFKGPFVEGIISKRLQPWSEADGWKICTFLGSSKSKIDYFIRVFNRDSITGYPVLESRGVEHRT